MLGYAMTKTPCLKITGALQTWHRRNTNPCAHSPFEVSAVFSGWMNGSGKSESMDQQILLQELLKTESGQIQCPRLLAIISKQIKLLG